MSPYIHESSLMRNGNLFCFLFSIAITVHVNTYIVCVYSVSVITQEEYSALMLAAMMGKIETVVELVKTGADVDVQNRVCQDIYMYIIRST